MILLLTCGFASSFVRQLHGGPTGAFLVGNTTTTSHEELRIVAAQMSLGASALVSVTSCLGVLLAILRQNTRSGDDDDNYDDVKVTCSEMMKDLRLSLVMASLTLCRSHNSFLVLVNYVSASLLHLFFAHSRSASPSLLFGPGSMAVLYMWMGNAFFYYQGNSNNLSTIDFSVGNTGQRGYWFLAAASLTFVHTFSSVLFWLLSLFIELLSRQKARPTCGMRSSRLHRGVEEVRGYGLHQGHFTPDLFPFSRGGNDDDWNGGDDDDDDDPRISSKDSTKDDLQTASLALLATQSLCSGFYLVVMITMRHHLFVWSVFAPKFLYSVVLHLLVALFAIVCNVILSSILSCNK